MGTITKAKVGVTNKKMGECKMINSIIEVESNIDMVLSRQGIKSDELEHVKEYAKVIVDYQLKYHAIAIFNVETTIDGQECHSLIYDRKEGLVYTNKRTHLLVHELADKTQCNGFLRGILANRVGRKRQIPYVVGHSIFLPLVDVTSEENVNWVNLRYCMSVETNSNKPKGPKLFRMLKNVRITFMLSSSDLSKAIHDSCTIAKGIQYLNELENEACGYEPRTVPIYAGSLVQNYSLCQCGNCKRIFISPKERRSLTADVILSGLLAAAIKKYDEEDGAVIYDELANDLKDQLLKILNVRKMTKEESALVDKSVQWYKDLSQGKYTELHEIDPAD